VREFGILQERIETKMTKTKDKITASTYASLLGVNIEGWGVDSVSLN